MQNVAEQSVNEGFVSMFYVHALLDYVRDQGVDTQRLLAESGLSDVMVGKSSRVPVMQWVDLFQLADIQLPEKDMGLHIGETIKPGHYGVVGYVTMSCATLGEAVENHIRYEQLISETAQTSLHVDGQDAWLEWECPLQPYPPRHLAEASIAGRVAYARWIAGQQPYLKEVWFQHPEPASTAEHERIFDCPVKFSQSHTRLIFPAAFLQLPLIQADPTLQGLMEQHAEQQLTKMVDENMLVMNIKRALNTCMQAGEPSLAIIAEEIEMSTRTLQRRLKEFGLSFQEILDETRKEIAIHYMNDDSLTLLDITFLLGFSEQSAFQRAFKRWTGFTPGKYRTRLDGLVD